MPLWSGVQSIPRSRCDVDPDKFSALHAMDLFIAPPLASTCMQEGAPPRGGRSASLDHIILRDAGLSDLKAELEQLAVDARRSPQRIVNAHPPDQRAQVRVDLRPTSKGVGFPTPVSAEAGSVPSHQGLGPDNRDGVEDCRTDTAG